MCETEEDGTEPMELTEPIIGRKISIEWNIRKSVQQHMIQL
jgi:hypothetical protein